jgi:hypothetical protein
MKKKCRHDTTNKSAPGRPTLKNTIALGEKGTLQKPWLYSLVSASGCLFTGRLPRPVLAAGYFLPLLSGLSSSGCYLFAVIN